MKKGCWRSHPHEEMNDECDQLTVLARDNSNLRARIAELEQAQRWIPVGERLPEHHKEYLVCTGENGDYHSETGITEFDPENGFFSDNYYSDITHWMLLPEPPQ